MSWNPSDTSVANTLSNANATVSGDHTTTIGVAVDFTHSKLWFYNPLQARWNSAVLASQNPATNTGGYSISGITGTIFPAWSGDTNGSNKCLLNCGASAFANTMPSGFSSWDTLAGSATTWNPSDKAATITLAAGNLTAQSGAASWNTVRGTNGLTAGLAYFEVSVSQNEATNGWMTGVANATASLTNYAGVSANGYTLQSEGSRYNNGFVGGGDSFVNNWFSTRGTTSRSSGKLYFEVRITASDTQQAIGIANATFPLGNVSVSNANTAALQGQGSLYIAASTIYTNAGNGFAAGQTVAVAVDLTNNLLWVWSPAGGRWNNDATANPATATGGKSISGVTGPFLPLFAQNMGNARNIGILNTGGSAFALTIPSGFQAWDAVLFPSSNMFFLGF